MKDTSDFQTLSANNTYLKYAKAHPVRGMAPETTAKYMISLPRTTFYKLVCQWAQEPPTDVPMIERQMLQAASAIIQKTVEAGWSYVPGIPDTILAEAVILLRDLKRNHGAFVPRDFEFVADLILGRGWEKHLRAMRRSRRHA